MKLDLCIDPLLAKSTPDKVIRQAAAAGFKAVETWQSDKNFLLDTKKTCDALGLSLVCTVVNAPNGAATALVSPATHKAFLEQLDTVSDNALAAGCSLGIACTGNRVADIPDDRQQQAVIDALKKASELAEAKGFFLVLEALNTRVDHAGYFLDDPDTGFDIIRAVGNPNVKLLYDIYHMGVQERDLQRDIMENIGLIGHFHAAGVPGRHEVYTGETDYPAVVEAIRKTGYRGYLGLEYFPSEEPGISLAKSLVQLTPRSPEIS